MNDAFNYIKEIGGLMKDSDYGYKGIESKCKFDQSKVGVKVIGFVDIPHDEE